MCNRYCYNALFKVYKNLNDKKWLIISPLLPGALPGGRPRSIGLRNLINAILYIVRSGCAWRLLPHEFPRWQTVYGYYRS